MRKLNLKTKLNKEVNSKMRKVSLVVVLALVAMMVMATAAFAAHNNFDSGAKNTYSNRTAIYNAGFTTKYSEDCDICHAAMQKSKSSNALGPHGQYTTTTKKCTTCHTLHSNVGVASNGRVALTQKLLPGATVTAVCNYCHDLTSANRAPYYVSYMNSESDIKSAHDVANITWSFNGPSAVGGGVYTATTRSAINIPGGNGASGGTLSYAGLFQEGDLSNSEAQTFTCDSCHTPHGISGSTVNAYAGEAARLDGNTTNRLLKKQLTVGGGVYTEYGSAWCAGCHMGRLTMAGSNYNHPVNNSGKGYNPTLRINNVTGNTTAALTAYNAWYAMTSGDALNGNASRPDGYIPISNFQSATLGVNGPSCQQCHASPRDVETAYAYSIGNDANGDLTGVLNPDAQSFPHVSKFPFLLVEDNTDDLCTNCHGLDNLP